MSIIISDEQQSEVDRMRIDLAQAVIDLAEVQPQNGDLHSRHNKDRVIEGLRQVRLCMDRLGLKHKAALRCGSANG